MLFGKAKPRVSDRLETVIGQNAQFNGHLKCEGNLRIDGYCEGIVEATGNIVIGEMGQIVAEVRAKNVSVSGSVKGTIYANRVDLLSTGRIHGDVIVDSFFLDEGGYIRGQVNMRHESGMGREATPVSTPSAIQPTIENPAMPLTASRTAISAPSGLTQPPVPPTPVSAPPASAEDAGGDIPPLEAVQAYQESSAGAGPTSQATNMEGNNFFSTPRAEINSMLTSLRIEGSGTVSAPRPVKKSLSGAESQDQATPDKK